MTMTNSASSDYRVYDSALVAIVYKTKESHGGLSNMASGFPLLVSGVRVATSEALYQACRFPDYPEIQIDILREPNPMVAKMRSKRYRATHTRTDWLAVRHNVMRWCLRQKLAQNFDTFSKLLIETGNLPIVERSRADRYWGAVPSKEGGTLVGRNVLGRLLMELREKLKAMPRDDLLTVEAPPISNFLLLGSPVGVSVFDGSSVSSVSDALGPQDRLI